MIDRMNAEALLANSLLLLQMDIAGETDDAIISVIAGDVRRALGEIETLRAALAVARLRVMHLEQAGMQAHELLTNGRNLPGLQAGVVNWLERLMPELKETDEEGD